MIDYAFGSGHHATTFVSMLDRTPDRPTILEHRLTAFAHRADLDITPGQGQARGPGREGMVTGGRRYNVDADVSSASSATLRSCPIEDRSSWTSRR